MLEVATEKLSASEVSTERTNARLTRTLSGQKVLQNVL